MTHSSPATYRAAALAARLFGLRRLAAAIEAAIRLRLAGPALRRGVLANLARIAAARPGSPASDPDPEAALRRLAAHYALERARLLAIGACEPGASCRVDLALLEPLRRLLSRGKGVVLVTPHFGDLPQAAAALARSGVPLTAVVVEAEPYRRVAPETGLRFAALGEAAADCLRALARGEAVLLYGDLDYFPDGRTLPFFGAPYFPPQGPVRLALASGAPLLPVYALMAGNAVRFENDEALEPAGAAREDLERALLASMERWIGPHPEQWFIFRDAWDLGASAALNRRQFNALRLLRDITA